MDIQNKFEELFANVFYLGPLREYPKRRYIWSGSEPEDVGRRGERAIDAILAAREKGKYIKRGYKKWYWDLDEMLAYRLKEMGLISSFKVEKITEGSNLYQVSVKKNSTSSDVLVTEVGFGVSQVLPVLVLCYYVPEGSTVIFEQPEIHLHPSVQNALADVFIDVALNRKIQVIFESHSEHLLNRFQTRMAEAKISSDDISLYFCEVNNDNGIINKLDVDIFGNIRNWPEDFFGDRFGEVAAKKKAELKRRIKLEEEAE